MDKGDGAKKSENFADVIYGWPRTASVLLRRLGRRLINPFAAPLSAVIDVCFPSSNAFFRPESPREQRERAAAPFPHSSRVRPTGSGRYFRHLAWQCEMGTLPN